MHLVTTRSIDGSKIYWTGRGWSRRQGDAVRLTLRGSIRILKSICLYDLDARRVRLLCPVR
jgi:hypothetical protein